MLLYAMYVPMSGRCALFVCICICMLYITVCKNVHMCYLHAYEYERLCVYTNVSILCNMCIVACMLNMYLCMWLCACIRMSLYCIIRYAKMCRLFVTCMYLCVCMPYVSIWYNTVCRQLHIVFMQVNMYLCMCCLCVCIPIYRYGILLYPTACIVCIYVSMCL